MIIIILKKTYKQQQAIMEIYINRKRAYLHFKKYLKERGGTLFKN